MRRRTNQPWLFLLALGFVVASCGTPPDDHADPKPASNPGGAPKVYAEYDPSQEIMPLPNDLVWLADGNPAVDLPPEAKDSAEMKQLKQLVNSLNLLGLSPNMFLSFPVSGAVDTNTLQVRVFRTNGLETPRTQADFQVVYATGVVKLLPKAPFTPGGAYAAAVKSTLLDANAFPVEPAPVMNALKSPAPFDADSPFAKLEGLRAAFNAPAGLFAAIEQNFGWAKSDVLLVWTFNVADKTLSLAPTAAEPSNATSYSAFSSLTAQFKGLSVQWTQDSLTWVDAGGGPSAAPVPIPASAVLTPRGIPNDALDKVYFGTYQSPDLSKNGQAGTSVPFLITTPKFGSRPYSTVVFQHGISRTKEDGFAVANSLAAHGLAMLAIDAPYHGDRNPDKAKYQSGELFFTANLIQDRLNFYQAAVDLWEAFDLITTGSGVNLDGILGADLSPTDVSFASLSLGTVIGSVFLSGDARPRKIFLANPAGQLSNVVDETARKDLTDLVAGLGYQKGTTPYYVFLNLAQWLLDPIDSMYMKIGTNPNANLLSIFAFGDPIVSPDCSRSFYAVLELSTPTIVDPSTIDTQNPTTFPSASFGAYQYGGAGTKRVIHGFLLSPGFDPGTELYYQGYDPALQALATFGAQIQAARWMAE